MHTLTLTFQTLAELTIAVNKLASGAGISVAFDDPHAGAWTAASKAKLGMTASELDTGSTKPAGKSKAEKAAVPAASAEPAPSPAPATAAEAKASAAAETPKAKPVDYPTLQAAVFKLAGVVQKKGLDQQEWVVAIAKGMGADNFKTLPSEKWAAALAAVKEQTEKAEALEEAVA